MAIDPKTYKHMTKKEKLKAIVDGKTNIILSQEEAKELLNIMNDLEELAVATSSCFDKLEEDGIDLSTEDLNLHNRSKALINQFNSKIKPTDLSWLKD